MRRHSPVSILVATALLVLPCCGGGGGGGDPPAVGFAIFATSPADDARDVPLETEVLVTFTEAIDPDSVDASTLRVGELTGAGEVPGTTTLYPDAEGRTIRWVATRLLEPFTTHEVQVAGGVRAMGGSTLGQLERFDFRTGRGDDAPLLPSRTDLRRTLGELVQGRRSHTATVIPGGPVLVAGGYTQGNAITDTAEIFNAEQFRLLDARMIQERASHTATRLQDGRILLTGGWYEISVGQLATTDTAEIYDPSTETFAAVGLMTTQRVDHQAVRLPDGTVLVTGGSRLVGAFLEDLDTAEIFDPLTSTFTALSEPMLHTRATHTMVSADDGTAVLVGGSDEDNRPSTFDPTTGTFTALVPPQNEAARWGPAGATFDSGAICIAGGDDLASVLHIDPGTGTVQNSGSPLSVSRAYATASRVTGMGVLVAGGVDFKRDRTLDSVDLVVEGGISGSRTYLTELVFPTAMVFHTATELLDGRILFCGGLAETFGEPALDGAYLFTPSN